MLRRPIADHGKPNGAAENRLSLRWVKPPRWWLGYRAVIFSTALTSSPTSRRSATRTAIFTGNRYAPVLRSGKSDVLHDVAPTVTATRTESKPRRIPSVSSVMSALISAGSDTKCQPSAPGYRHSGAANCKAPGARRRLTLLGTTGGTGPAQAGRSPR